MDTAGEWDDSNAYESLQQIYLRRHGDHLGPIFRLRTVADPFGQPVAIRLDEWKGIAELYALRRSGVWLGSARPGTTRRIPPLIDQVLGDTGSPFFGTKGKPGLYRHAAQAFFADSLRKQKRPLEHIKKASQRGDNSSRQYASKLRRQIPRTRRQHSGWEILSLVLPYRAERRLLWLYLRAELMQAGWDDRDHTKPMRLWLRPIIDEMLVALPWLSAFYGLNATRIIAGLQQAEQADIETAKRFRFASANALQKFLSTFRPSY